MDTIIVKNLCKHYKVFYDKGQTFKEKLLFKNRNYFEKRQVLKDVSFTISKGQAVGLMGENGSGKSTTLKLLTRIIYPDSGSIEMVGRVSSLIELGAGFHPDLSGRENIYTNASIFGLTHDEIKKRENEIIEFSELGEFIDNPVRTYSSGMYMRLAFSVAINVDADILLIDEILAVGDASFQAKCFDKLKRLKSSGTTIVIVSHALGQIEQFCDRAIWIDKGLVKLDASPREVIPSYIDWMGEKRGIVSSTTTTSKEEGIKRVGNQDIEVTSVKMISQNNENNRFRTGDSVKIIIDYKVNKAVQNPVFGIGIFRNDGIHCYGTNTRLDAVSTSKLGVTGSVTFSIKDLNLLPSEYTLDVAIHTEDDFYFDGLYKVITFKTHSSISDIGVARINHEWIIGEGNDE